MKWNEEQLLTDIWNKLRCVQDPEIRLDIVNLGLIYNIQLKSADDNKFKVVIEMTLTSPTCSMAPYIFEGIHGAVGFIEGVSSIDIQLVWDPPWTQDRVSKEGKMELGWV